MCHHQKYDYSYALDDDDDDGPHVKRSRTWDHVTTVSVYYVREDITHPDYVCLRLLEDIQYPPLSKQALEGKVWLRSGREILVLPQPLKTPSYPNRPILLCQRPTFVCDKEKDLDFSLDTLFWDMQVELIHPTINSIVLLREHKATVNALLPFLPPVLVTIVLRLLALVDQNENLRRLRTTLDIKENY